MCCVRPASGKVKASISANELQLHHYHHLLLKYDLTTRRPTYQWHEKPTDKRILLAALDTLKEEADRLQSKFNGASSSGAGSEAAGQKRRGSKGPQAAVRSLQAQQ